MTVPITPESDRNDLFGPDFLENPYPTYEKLRRDFPAYWLKHGGSTGGMWMFTRYADADAILRDAQRFTNDMHRVVQGLPRPMAPHLLNSDPPDHTRVRNLVAGAFTPRVVQNLAPHVQSIADHLIDRALERGSMDVMADYALPLPVIVIAELLGVPVADRDMFCGWSSAIIDVGDVVTGTTPESVQRSQRATAELLAYLGQLIQQRGSDPRDDLISRLIAARDEGGKLTEGELLSTCFLLLLAGHETTVNLIGNGTLALLRHPDQLELLRARPDLLGSAVDEMLRFDAPVQRTLFRAALEDVTVGEHTVRAGQQVSVVIGAANHDPAVFEHPDRFDITRSPNRHLSFGRGIHFCLGAPLARLEATISFERLLTRLPDLRLASGGYERRPSTAFRGLRHLHVDT